MRPNLHLRHKKGAGCAVFFFGRARAHVLLLADAEQRNVHAAPRRRRPLKTGGFCLRSTGTPYRDAPVQLLFADSIHKTVQDIRVVLRKPRHVAKLGVCVLPFAQHAEQPHVFLGSARAKHAAGERDRRVKMRPARSLADQFEGAEDGREFFARVLATADVAARDRSQELQLHRQPFLTRATRSAVNTLSAFRLRLCEICSEARPVNTRRAEEGYHCSRCRSEEGRNAELGPLLHQWSRENNLVCGRVPSIFCFDVGVVQVPTPVADIYMQLTDLERLLLSPVSVVMRVRSLLCSRSPR